jgi:hypothetical protein
VIFYHVDSASYEILDVDDSKNYLLPESQVWFYLTVYMCMVIHTYDDGDSEMVMMIDWLIDWLIDELIHVGDSVGSDGYSASIVKVWVRICFIPGHD